MADGGLAHRWANDDDDDGGAWTLIRNPVLRIVVGRIGWFLSFFLSVSLQWSLHVIMRVDLSDGRIDFAQIITILQWCIFFVHIRCWFT